MLGAGVLREVEQARLHPQALAAALQELALARDHVGHVGRRAAHQPR